MFNRLQQKWKVTGGQLFIILLVFAITGTTTAYITKVITSWVGFTSETSWIWKMLLRLVMLIFGYQVILLTVAFIFGQFSFFWKYEKKLLRWMGMVGKAEGRRQEVGSNEQSAISNQQSAVSDQQSAISNTQSAIGNRQSKISNFKSQISNQKSAINIAVFASGAGSNAQKIIDYFRDHPSVKVALIVSNKPEAGVLHIAEREKIATLIIDKGKFFRDNGYVDELKSLDIDWIILAGFLWKIPLSLIHAFPSHIINIHPALLPKYGGKGMYGHFVHEAVIAAGEVESGITIHYVDEHFDHGKHILQVSCPVEKTDTPQTLAKKIHALEHAHYPEAIYNLIKDSI
ncbi:MAG: phosphoribosylglycinamide formyltransferase [Agriterribacter sp.]